MPDLVSVQPAAVVPRSQVSVGVEPLLRQALAGLANGRVLVIDYFASRRCSVTIGDTMADFEATPPGGGYIELASIEGVRVFVEARLMPILSDAGPTLHLGGPPFARHLSVRLERPERWIEFLDAPGVLAGKRRFRSARSGQGLR
jgi:hypothetical protein